MCKKHTHSQRKKERQIEINMRDFAELFILRVNEVLDNGLKLIYVKRSAALAISWVASRAKFGSGSPLGMNTWLLETRIRCQNMCLIFISSVFFRGRLGWAIGRFISFSSWCRSFGLGFGCCVVGDCGDFRLVQCFLFSWAAIEKRRSVGDGSSLRLSR